MREERRIELIYFWIPIIAIVTCVVMLIVFGSDDGAVLYMQPDGTVSTAPIGVPLNQ